MARAAVRHSDGKIVTKRRVLPPGADVQQAIAAVAELKAEIRAQTTPGALRPTTSQTLEDYAVQWLSLRSKRLKPSAKATYQLALAHHVLPRLGFLRCDEVVRQAVEAWVVWAEARRKPDGTLYAEATMRQWWRVLKTVVRDMAADLNLPDPIQRVRPPERPEMDLKREQRTLTIDQVSAVLRVAREDWPDRYAEIVMIALTAMRPSEIYALKWERIDTTREHAHVCASISDGVWTPTSKTKAHRDVPLHPLIMEALVQHRRQAIEQQRLGLDTGLVFPSNKGTPRTAHSLDRPFLAIAAKLGLEINLGCQVLRRSMNTILVEQSVDRLTIRSIIGHTSEQMTKRYYGATAAKKRAAVLSLPVSIQPEVDNREE